MEKSGKQFLPMVVLCMAILTFIIVPPFCNRIVMGSEFSGGTVSLQTSSSNRVTCAVSESPVEMLYQVKVNEYRDTIPSQGTVSAFTYGTLQEGRDDSAPVYQKASFTDMTSVRGSIILFEKSMRHTSGLPTVF
jgi:hypothetical protein